jgi:glyoxylase-like metal-dependent hydrolase (beta-lactamase superfamily II)
VLCSQCEVLLEGQGPWKLPSSRDSSISSSIGSGGGAHSASENDDVQLVFTPGHTAGCVSLLYPPDQALFSGDHLAWSHRLQRLTIFRAYNWHSVAQQLDSAAALRQLEFLHLLPGHGRRAEFSGSADRVRQVDSMLAAEGYSGQPAYM